MPRIAEARSPASPSSQNQIDRQRRILRAATRLGADHGLERVQMHEVAREAGVAIATLYRYFPSKTHLFTGVMAAQVDRLAESTPPLRAGADPVDAVAGLLRTASRELMRRPLLATAMMQANSSAHAMGIADAERIDTTFRGLILRILGIEEPTADDVTLVRLLVHCWFGVLTVCLNGGLSMPEAESDIRRAARLLLAPRSTAAQPDVAR